MFRIISILSVVIVLAGLYYLGRRQEQAANVSLGAIFRDAVDFKGLQWQGWRSLDTGSLLDLLRAASFIGIVLSSAVLALTGFFQPWFLNSHISGFMLMLHSLAAPVFIVAITIYALLMAHRSQIRWKELIRFRQANGQTEPGDTGPGWYGILRRTCFWLLLILAIPVILSVTLTMYSVLGTPGQMWFLGLHRYSSLLFVLIFLVFLMASRFEEELE